MPEFSEDDQWLLSIVAQLTKSLPELHQRTPDLIEGYLSGRYVIALAANGPTLYARPTDDPAELLEGGR